MEQSNDAEVGIKSEVKGNKIPIDDEAMGNSLKELNTNQSKSILIQAIEVEPSNGSEQTNTKDDSTNNSSGAGIIDEPVNVLEVSLDDIQESSLKATNANTLQLELNQAFEVQPGSDSKLITIKNDSDKSSGKVENKHKPTVDGIQESSLISQNSDKTEPELDQVNIELQSNKSYIQTTVKDDLENRFGELQDKDKQPTGRETEADSLIELIADHTQSEINQAIEHQPSDDSNLTIENDLENSSFEIENKHKQSTEVFEPGSFPVPNADETQPEIYQAIDLLPSDDSDLTSIKNDLEYSSIEIENKDRQSTELGSFPVPNADESKLEGEQAMELKPNDNSELTSVKDYFGKTSGEMKIENKQPTEDIEVGSFPVPKTDERKPEGMQTMELKPSVDSELSFINNDLEVSSGEIENKDRQPEVNQAMELQPNNSNFEESSGKVENKDRQPIEDLRKSSPQEPNSKQIQPEIDEAMELQPSNNFDYLNDSSGEVENIGKQPTSGADQTQPDVDQAVKFQPSNNSDYLTNKDDTKLLTPILVSKDEKNPGTHSEDQTKTDHAVHSAFEKLTDVKKASIEVPDSNKNYEHDSQMSNQKGNLKAMKTAVKTNDNKTQPNQDLTKINKNSLSDTNTDQQAIKQTKHQITDSTTPETDISDQTNEVENKNKSKITYYTYNSHIAPTIKLISVKTFHIIEVMRALGIDYKLEGALYNRYCKKFCSLFNQNIVPYWKGGPIEELNENDDENNCKILYMEVPPDWGAVHVKTLLHIKTAFDPNARYHKILYLKALQMNRSCRKFLLRFLTHQDCMQVYNHLKGTKLFKRLMRLKLDIGYNIAKNTAIIGPMAELDIKKNTYQIEFNEYKLLKIALRSQMRNSLSKVHKVTTDSSPEISTVKKELIDTTVKHEMYDESISMTIEDKKDNLNPSNTSMDVTGKKTPGTESNDEETDESHCKIVQITNIPQRKCTHTAVQQLLKHYSIYDSSKIVLQMAYNGVALVECLNHGIALRLVKELNGRVTAGKKITAKLDIGHEATRSLLSKARESPTKRKRENETDQTTDYTSMDEPPFKRVKHKDINVANLKTVSLPPREHDLDAYGLSPKFLKSLSLNQKITEAIFVSNLHPEVDDDKLLEVFSLAGIIKYIKYNGPLVCTAVISYDHPVEAVQAISMFNNQILYNREMVVKMIYNQTRLVPLGLQTIGKGLGNKGRPLTGVRNYVESKQTQRKLAELGKLKEVSLTDHPFSFTYVEPTNDPPKTFGKQKQTNTQSHAQGGCTPNPPVVKPNTINSFANSSNTSKQIDGSAVALGAILAIHGLIDKQSKCHDVGSILTAIRTNREKITGNNDTPISSAVVTNPYTGPSTSNNLPNSSVMSQYNQPNVVPNAPNWALNNPCITSNSSNFALNAMQMQLPNAPNSGTNISPNANHFGVNALNMAPNTLNMVPNALNMVPNAFNMAPNALNFNQTVPNMWQQRSTRFDQPPTNQPQITNHVPLMQNFAHFDIPTMAQNTQQNLNQSMPRNQSYNENKPQQNYHDRYEDHSQGKIEKRKNFEEAEKSVISEKKFREPKSEYSEKRFKEPNSEYSEKRFKQSNSEFSEKKRSDDSKSDLLIFSNLPQTVTIEALNKKMCEIGEVTYSEITGQGRAIVRFKRYQDAKRCIKKFHRSKVDYQIIEVNFV